MYASGDPVDPIISRDLNMVIDVVDQGWQG